MAHRQYDPEHNSEKLNSEKDEQYRHDLNPHDRAGENNIPIHASSRSAYDIKEAHHLLHMLPNSALKQIPILDLGTRLKEGATYYDLAYPDRGAIKGMNNMTVGSDNIIVAKSDVDYELWNLITGSNNLAELGRFSPDKQS